MKNEFLVSIRCMSYNHASFIEDCMNGFTIQKTNFPYVCVIDDDASTDGEPEVIKTYLDENFNMDDKSVFRCEETDDYRLIFAQHKINRNCFFAVFFLKYNHYSIRKSKSYVDEFVEGTKYRAICEGDDYWIDPNKLEKQVNYLENRPNCALCYTKALRKNNNKILGSWGDEDCSIEGLLNGSIIPTLTRVERKTSFNDFFNEVKPDKQQWMMGDYANVLYYSIKSSIGYLEDYTSVYRILDESSSHSKDINKMLKFYDSADNIRYFFIKNYIDDIEKKEELSRMVKINEIKYKLKLYTQHYMIKEASVLYKSEKSLLPTMTRIKYRLETFSEVISPAFVFIFNIKQVIKNLIKSIYLSI